MKEQPIYRIEILPGLARVGTLDFIILTKIWFKIRSP
jgi:hypothetical protein